MKKPSQVDGDEVPPFVVRSSLSGLRTKFTGSAPTASGLVFASSTRPTGVTGRPCDCRLIVYLDAPDEEGQ